MCFIPVFRDIFQKEVQIAKVESNMEHREKKDSRGMFPLQEKINILTTLKQIYLPTLITYFFAFCVSYFIPQALGLASEEVAILTTLLALFLSTLCFIFCSKKDWKGASFSFFYNYEWGRQFWSFP